MVIDVDILILICSFNFFKEKKSRPYYHLQIFVGGEYGDLGIHYIYAERVAFLWVRCLWQGDDSSHFIDLLCVM